MPALLQTGLLSDFSCLGERCPDTCCKGWSMQLDAPTYARYESEAPELLSAVEPSVEAPLIMKKDAAGACVKFEGGLCGIHTRYGDGFLGDACHFYPRATRRLGEDIVMTATMSCPEIARLALVRDDASALTDAALDRLPHEVKNYLPEGMHADDALALHHACMAAAGDASVSPERAYLRLATVSRFLGRIDMVSWPQAIGVYLKTADAMLPTPEKNINDPFNLLHALCGLIAAVKKPVPERLARTISDMEAALSVRLDWQAVAIHTNERSLQAYEKTRALYLQEAADFCAPILRRWLQMQLSLALFPFAGLGSTLPERITLIGVRMATLKLAIMCAYAIDRASLSQDSVVRIVQSLSRFLDHLGDPAFSLQIYAETGWIAEARMRALVE